MVYKSPKELELIEKIEPIVASLNYELRDISIRNQRPTLIRLTLDIPDRSRLITLDDCQEVHKTVDPLFDVWDPIEGNYTLEVSSPGEKAPLRLYSHFKEAVGGEIDFKTREAIVIESVPSAAPRKNWKATLLEVNENNKTIKLEDPMGVHEIPMDIIEQARWLRNWNVK